MLEEWFGVEQLPEELPNSTNVAPSENVLAGVGSGALTAKLMRWGMPAPWDSKKRLTNARSETVATARSFKKLFATQRCVVFGSAYYEWKSAGLKKQAYRVVARQPVFAFAALYESTGNLHHTVLLTRAATEQMAQLHDRLPVIFLERDEVEAYLSAEEPEVARDLALDTAPEGLRIQTVATQGIGNPRYKGEVAVTEELF